jgi:hypothetical protein
MSDRLSTKEIMIIVNRYIGVNSGYLVDCDLDIDPYEYYGTTRERFIEILSTQNSKDQAKIIKGVIDRFPVESENKPETRTENLKEMLLEVINRIESEGEVNLEELNGTYDVINQALHDSEILIRNSNPSSGIDRIVTALHGYMENVLISENIAFKEDTSITGLYKIIRDNHSAFQISGHREEDISRILKTLSSIIDTLQPIRNRASLAHPNELLEKPESLLVINTTKTIIQYFEDRIKNKK